MGEKGALLLVPMAVFFKSRKCADMAKWTIPVFALLSWVTYGDYFFASRPADTAAEEILDSFGNVLPLSLEAALFFAENGLLVLISVLLFARDGVRTDPLSFMYFAPVLVACMPLNIFENFFDINDFPKNSAWRFYSFTPWARRGGIAADRRDCRLLVVAARQDPRGAGKTARRACDSYCS